MRDFLHVYISPKRSDLLKQTYSFKYVEVTVYKYVCFFGQHAFKCENVYFCDKNQRSKNALHQFMQNLDFGKPCKIYQFLIIQAALKLSVAPI